MIPFDELHRQNHEISELSQVLSVLISDRSMCDSKVTCELFERFGESFRAHMDMEDKTIYSNLLMSKDKQVNSSALRSLNSSKELKRLFTSYMNRWCHKGSLRIEDHEEFVKETREMFGFILDRVQDETEQLFPLARDTEQHRMAANG